FHDGSDDLFHLATKENEDFSTGEILQELDLEGGTKLLETDWFTEKFDFDSFDPSALNSTDTLQELTQVESSFCGSLLPEISDELLMPFPGEDITIPTEMPATPEQNVPEYQALSPYSTSSEVSACLASPVDSNPLSPCSNYSDGSTDCSVTLIDLLSSDEQNNTEAQSQSQSNSTPKRATPYTRPHSKQSPKPKVKTPAQKQRKRVQNKDAATRYRVKKRSEQDVLFQEAEKIEEENTKLRDQVASIGKELEYLKNLMLEVYQTKQKKQQQQQQQ
ncbi:hypothetical protein QZH41_013987, partial [Actinostola sp. cb2023]